MAGPRVVREHDDVVTCGEIPRLELGILERGVGEVELLEHQPGPPFRHVAAAVALVHGDSGRGDVAHHAVRDVAGGGEVDAGVARHRGEVARGAAHDEVTRGQVAARLLHALYRRAAGEELVDGAEAVVEPAGEAMDVGVGHAAGHRDRLVEHP